MTARNVITDDFTNEEIPKGHEYYEVMIVREGSYNEYTHYASWGSVLKALSVGGMKEATIRRCKSY